MFPGMLLAAGGLAGSLFDFYSQNQANKSNERSAQRQMDFQKQMSNTAYQRAVTDMKSAGLNPALMYGSGSAAQTPGGSSSNSQSANVGHHLSNSARAIALERQSVESQIQLNRSSAMLNAANARLSQASAKRTEFDLPKHEVHGTIYGGANSALKFGKSVGSDAYSRVSKFFKDVMK